MEPTTLPRVPATYEDLKKVPDHLVAQIVDGELIVHPRPALPHVYVSSQLGALLGPPFSNGNGGPGDWVILDEPELHLGPDILVPDLAGWKRERMPQFPQAPYFTLVPDWVCEVLSPSTEQVDRERKLPIYAREGIRHVWLIDPGIQELTVFRLDTGHYTRIGIFNEEDIARAAPFDAVALELEQLWPY
jgi:Uma2 family endonuclease